MKIAAFPALPKRLRSGVLGAALAACASLAIAATPASVASSETPANSGLDAPLFYQLLIGEIELTAGEPGTAYEVILDAARRTRDDQLFRRAVDIALQARAGDQALAGTRTWRTALPDSLDAVRMQVQILSALNRLSDTTEPLRTLIKLTPDAERPALISALPRAVQRAPDRQRAAAALDEVLLPFFKDQTLAVPALVASGRGWLGAGEADRALALAQAAHSLDAAAPGAALLAMEMMAGKPAAEAIVTAHLRSPAPEIAVRLSYVRALAAAQRFTDAIEQLDIVTREKPELAPPYLTLGALHLELRQLVPAEAALQKFLAVAASTPSTPPPAVAQGDDEDDEQGRPEQAVIEAWLLLARSAELRNDFVAAEGWLARIDDPKRALEVQTRRATLLARQGRIAEAREAVRLTPERGSTDARAKLMAEAGVLRDVKRFDEAYALLGVAGERFAEDSDLLYEQAMMAEKLDRFDDAERLLRRVIAIKPDNAHAHNALGYALADRSVRLPEAQALIKRALELAPGDPFITDSLGWVEYRLGNLVEAQNLLRQAYSARPDAEIGTHLGEVLWAQGQREEARRVWREAKMRDDANESLRETLARLKVDL